MRESKITLTKSDIVEIFEIWKKEYESNPEDFVDVSVENYGNGCASAFLEYHTKLLASKKRVVHKTVGTT